MGISGFDFDLSIELLTGMHMHVRLDAGDIQESRVA